MNITGFSTFLNSLKESRAHFQGATDSQIQYTILRSVLTTDKTIIVVPTHKDLSAWSVFFETYTELFDEKKISPSILPFLTSWGADRYVNPALSKRQRLQSLQNLRDPARKCVVVTTLLGLAQFTQSIDTYDQFSFSLEVDQELEQETLISLIEAAGYHSTPVVDEEGLYSVRGSIVDIFPPCELDPIRVEFIGESIASIRYFGVDDQKSRKHLNAIVIPPASECVIANDSRKQKGQLLYDYLLTQNNVASHDRDGLMDTFIRGIRSHLLDLMQPILNSNQVPSFKYCTSPFSIIFPNGFDACSGYYESTLLEFQNSFKNDLKTGKITLDPNLHFEKISNIEAIISKAISIQEFATPFPKFSQTTISFKQQTTFSDVSRSPNATTRFDQWIIAIKQLVDVDLGTAIIIATSQESCERISTLLSHRELSAEITNKALLPLESDLTQLRGKTFVTKGDLANWLWFEDEKILFVPEHLIFGVTQKKQRSSNRRLKNYLSSFRDLKVGDLVVHVQHGIGRYKGMNTMTVAGYQGDFLHLEYAAGDKIFLPAEKLNLLQRYSAGSEGDTDTASLDRLGSGGWERKKAKATQAIKEMADKILLLQAQRSLAPIHIFSKPNDDYFKFEAEFPYSETDDQLKAIAEVNHDLESNKPMDRLICGDVGFGKTEVALRAVYRAVQEGFQVLVLVPTTILCYQHYRNFTDRLSKHGIKVAQLNRFVPSAIAKETLADTASGRVDVLVGTHKILSPSLKVKRLGLIVVDEEQRFGVTHKERLKELRAGADIITLTATPIPRTLHMAMLGLRDISIIATPPQSRLSVKTYVARFDETLIKDAIERELSRGGQVFYVHNRVEDIAATTAFVKSLVPKAQVRFAHGQMKENELESAIIDFIEQKFEVLVCTTIIESGVDMPNVNTLIVDQADRFGLAQLYQMRGRVGRSSVQAYAYFLTKNASQLTEEARRRLDVLANHQELGAGFQIASHDLEIRGAGNLLGADQSGHAAEIGLEMYTDLLAEAIAEIRQQPLPKQKVDCEIKLPITALLSNSYIPTEGLRLQLYKSLFSIETLEELSQLKTDAIDRYGLMPEEAARLFLVAEIKHMLSFMGATLLTMNPQGGFFEIRFAKLTEKQIDLILKEVQRNPKTFRLSPDYKLFIYWESEALKTKLVDATQNLILSTLIDKLKPLVSEMGLD